MMIVYFFLIDSAVVRPCRRWFDSLLLKSVSMSEIPSLNSGQEKRCKRPNNWQLLARSCQPYSDKHLFKNVVMRNINQFRNVRSAKENLRKWIQEVIAMDNDAPVMRKTSNKKLPACGERVDNLLFSVLTRRFATNKEECNSLVMKQLVLCLLIANKPTTGNDVVADMNNLYNSSWARRFCIRNLLPTTFANVRISNVPLSLEELNSALLIVNVRLSNESIQYVMRFVTRLDVEQTIKAPQENMQCSESVISTNLQDDSDLSEEFCISLEADMTQEQPSSHHMQDGAMSAKSFIENYLLDMFHGRQVVTFTPTNSSCSTVKRRSIVTEELLKINPSRRLHCCSRSVCGHRS